MVVLLGRYLIFLFRMAPKTIGRRGKPLNSQVREIIDNISRFMEKEANQGMQIPLKKYRLVQVSIIF